MAARWMETGGGAERRHGLHLHKKKRAAKKGKARARRKQISKQQSVWGEVLLSVAQ